MTIVPDHIELSRRGWQLLLAEKSDPGDVVHIMNKIADQLGQRAVGRARAIQEIIQPVAANKAHVRSLSAKFGVAEFPFHAELSHRPKPCRYVLLGCIDPGEPSTATRLINWRAFGFSATEHQVLTSAPILVNTGRRSFYSTLLSREHGFLRYDPGCIEAVDKRGEEAIHIVVEHLARAVPHEHFWGVGEILLVDNWTTLHGRGPAVVDTGRKLARILIDG